MNRRGFIGSAIAVFAGIAARLRRAPVTATSHAYVRCAVCGSESHRESPFGWKYGCPCAMPDPKRSTSEVAIFRYGLKGVTSLAKWRSPEEAESWKRFDGKGSIYA